MRIRRGSNDENLVQFKEFVEQLEKKGVEGMIGNGGGWDTLWAKGIIVFDDIVDKDPIAAIENDSHIPYMSHADEDETFTVIFKSDFFSSLADRTKSLINRYLWNQEKAMFYDFDCNKQEQSVYDSVTAIYALWAGVCSLEQAELLVPKALLLFEVTGGLVSGTEESRGRLGLDRPSRQWDHPFGWAPHQILAWKALQNYAFDKEARRIAYRWLYTITTSFVDFNGVIPEKFDVVNMTHNVHVEYGNVGTDFKMVVREGFGWMNASFQVDSL